MWLRISLILVICVCVAIPIAAQAPVSDIEAMALISAGHFWLGRAHSFFLESIDIRARDRMDDIPANRVYLGAFYIDQYHVTNQDYERFVQATGTITPWHWPHGQIPEGEGQLPVANVSWFEASQYCEWAGKRLPTEAEWEKAARGGLDRNRYAWGDAEVNTFDEAGSIQHGARRNTNSPVQAALGLSRAIPVGSFPPNGYGIYDMGGNMMEWVSDWYDSNYYPFMSKENPRGPETGIYRSVRGSSWVDDDGHGDTNMVHYRKFTDPELRMTTIGMRCARDAN